MFRPWFTRLALLGLCGVFVQPASYGQEEQKSDAKSDKASTATEKTVTVRIATGKHWIGVMAVPIDESLKAQLNLKDRLIVHHVLPESPAGKAGLQTHDILLKYGDKEIANLQDLIDAVSASKDTESKLTVLRAGKEVTVSITPGERPVEDQLQLLLPKGHPEALGHWLEQAAKGANDGSFTFRGFGPGVMATKIVKQSEFPTGLSITVSKDDDKPAQIIAKKDGKTYDTTADKLDILPKDIRSHVERLLHGPQVMAWGPGGDAKGVDGAIRYRINAERAQELQKATEEQAQKAADEALQKAKAFKQRVEFRKLEGGEISELKKEVEALRKAVEELKGAKAEKSDK